MIRKHLLLICSLSFLSIGCQKKYTTIDSLLTDQYQSGKLNGNVLVIKEGRTIYENSFGYVNGAKQVLLSKAYRFNIGSIYKEFPAVGIMQLEEQQLLHLNDSIGKYLPNLPAWSNQISIKHLLQYSSGLPMINWEKYFSQGKEITNEAIWNDIINIEKLEFTPGSNYLYTNLSPLLLIKIIEQVTQLGFDRYLFDNLLSPNKLEGTVIKTAYPYKDPELMAIPFNQEFKEDAYALSISNILVGSTASDLYNWFDRLETFKIINKQYVQFLSEVAIKGDNIQSPLGHCIWKRDMITEHTHHGSMANYECLVRSFPQEKLTILILTNQKQGNVFELSDKILDIVNSSIEE